MSSVNATAPRSLRHLLGHLGVGGLARDGHAGIGDHQLRALAGELLGDRAPDAARAARDQRDPALQAEGCAHAAAALCAGGAAL